MDAIDAKQALLDELSQMQENNSAIEQKKEEISTKKFALEERRVNAEYENMLESDRAITVIETTNFGAMTQEQIERESADAAAYFDAAKFKMEFVNKSLDESIPFFRKNLIVIGAKTGNGKTQLLANCVHNILSQRNPITGQMRRALVITNEETTIDIYNRVTCLVKGWTYENHEKFTDEQKQVMDKYFRVMAGKGSLVVVDDNYNGATGVTKTIEGIERIFENLIATETWYDVVIIDYYQNINSSSKNPKLDQFRVQEKAAALFDRYKNIYPAPIVVFTQLKSSEPGEETDDGMPFELRLKGSKSIIVPATHVFEIVADHQNCRTECKIHKSRYRPKSVGGIFYLGYDRGRLVAYTKDFIAQVDARRTDESKLALEKIQDKTDEKKEKVK